MFATEYMKFVPKVDEAFSLYTKMLLGFGVMFEMPTLVFFLARMGVVTGWFMLRYFKYAILVIPIVAAVVSPGTDAVSMTVSPIPMLAPSVLSIFIALIFPRPPTP